jgi:hypothetical protein
MIIHKSFKHGWFYHYRIHSPKAERLCDNGFSPLRKYLHDVMDNCPDEYFLKGPRGSGIKKVLEVDMKKFKGHEVSELARIGLESKRYNTAHSNVQMFMLEQDNKTISIEVPIWMLDTECENFCELLDSSDALTGHIDALRIEDGNIWVWDYKPNAAKERYAATQVQFYSMMLSKRTGIPLEKFRCGYFDEDIAFAFRPQVNPILKSSLK